MYAPRRALRVDFEEYYEEEDIPKEEMAKPVPKPETKPVAKHPSPPAKKSTAKKQGSIMSFFSKK